MHDIKGALSNSDNKCKQFSLSGKLGILFVNELAGSLSPYSFANTGICINWAVVVVLRWLLMIRSWLQVLLPQNVFPREPAVLKFVQCKPSKRLELKLQLCCLMDTYRQSPGTRKEKKQSKN